jgi:hypothetical protein
MYAGGRPECDSLTSESIIAVPTVMILLRNREALSSTLDTEIDYPEFSWYSPVTLAITGTAL